MDSAPQNPDGGRRGPTEAAQIDSASQIDPTTVDLDLPESSDELSVAGAKARQLFLGIGPLAASCFYMWQVLKLPEPGRPLVMSPQSMPLIAAVGMLATSVAITVALLIPRWRSVGQERAEPLDVRDVLAAAASVVIVAVVFEQLGFLISIAVLVAALSTLVSPRQWKRNCIVAIAFALIAEALFQGLLGVHLPPGILSLPLT